MKYLKRFEAMYEIEDRLKIDNNIFLRNFKEDDIVVSVVRAPLLDLWIGHQYVVRHVVGSNVFVYDIYNNAKMCIEKMFLISKEDYDNYETLVASNKYNL